MGLVECCIQRGRVDEACCVIATRAKSSAGGIYGWDKIPPAYQIKRGYVVRPYTLKRIGHENSHTDCLQVRKEVYSCLLCRRKSEFELGHWNCQKFRRQRARVGSYL